MSRSGQALVRNSDPLWFASPSARLGAARGAAMSKKRSKIHPKYKTTYRVRNWSTYERGLVRRGDLTIWFACEVLNRMISLGMPHSIAILAA
jgi:hypothetical protein